MKQTLTSPVFVVGMPRSGTTLLRMRLAQSGVAIPPETHYLTRWCRGEPGTGLQPASGRSAFERMSTDPAFVNFALDPADILNELERTPFSRRDVLDVILHLWARREGLPRAGEKTPGHYAHLDTLLSWFPDARVVFLVRDPRAVLHSIRDAYWWHGDVERTARRWAEASRVLRAHEADQRVRPLSYERLAREPRTELRALWSWLDLAFDDAVVEGIQPLRRPDSRHDDAQQWYQHNRSRLVAPINADAVDRWRTHLKRREIAVVEHAAGEQLEARGYERTDTRPSAARRVTVLAARGQHRLGRLRHHVTRARRAGEARRVDGRKT